MSRPRARRRMASSSLDGALVVTEAAGGQGRRGVRLVLPPRRPRPPGASAGPSGTRAARSAGPPSPRTIATPTSRTSATARSRATRSATTAPGLKSLRFRAGSAEYDESFYRKKVPVLFLFTGLHDEYHQPTDTPDARRALRWLRLSGCREDLVLDLSSTLARPRYREQTGGFEDPLNPHRAPRPVGGVRLGVRARTTRTWGPRDADRGVPPRAGSPRRAGLKRGRRDRGDGRGAGAERERATWPR